MNRNDLIDLIQRRARIAMVLTNMLKEDAAKLYEQTQGDDLVIFEDSISDLKRGVNQLNEVVNYLEYYLYLLKKYA